MDSAAKDDDEVQPTLVTFYNSIDEPFSFVPEEIKKEFMAEAIINDVNQGTNKFLANSPRAKKLKTVVELGKEYLTEDKQLGLVKTTLSAYLQQKKEEKELTTKEIPTNYQRQIQLEAPSTQYQSTISEVCAAACLHMNPPTTSVQIKPSASSIDSKQHTTHEKAINLDDVVESEFVNLAAALDFLGPGVIVSKSYTSSPAPINLGIPTGWYLRTFRCYQKSCVSKFFIWSPTKHLSSKPALIRIESATQHASHHPLDWTQWYAYKAAVDTDGSHWDDETYPPKPGLPYFIQLAVEDILRVTPNAQPAQTARIVSSRFNGHDLFLNPSITTEFITIQIQSLVKRSRQKKKESPSIAITRIKYAGDIWDYIQRHRINYSKISQVTWKDKTERGANYTRAFASALKDLGALSGIGMYDHLPEMDLIVLDCDEVMNDSRWQYLTGSTDKKHKTGPDPRRRTVVFSSLALLGNAIWCQDNKWNVSASVDGTHGMSKTQYKLLTLGVYGFSKKRGCRTFHPLVYIWGEGEREIVALHGFLNLKFALRRLFGIQNVSFKHGVVTDASPALVNAILKAFPTSPLLSCYPHIIRKFMVNGRSGNGGYICNLKSQPKSWLEAEAEPAIRRCALCKTKEQRDKMWKLTEQKWIVDGESEMARTFASTYIHDPNYSNWYYSASGQHGAVPCNNPMERHNLAIKGTTNFYGYVEIGKDMYSCLTKEFVTLVYLSSTNLSFPSSGIPVLDYKKASHNNQFMQFQSILDPKVDVRQYGGGWLINDVEYLTETITDDDIKRMEMAKAGEIEENLNVEGQEDIREVLLTSTRRFHFVKEAVYPSENGNVKFFECDCRLYYFQRWCFPAAYMQHRDDLRLLGQKISNNGTTTSKRNQYTFIAKALKVACSKLNKNKK